MSTDTVNKTPLEDVMAAMDVVDTLRHQQNIATRELNVEGRREELLQRLRKIYQAQGIAVSDTVLMEGIKALEEQRFVYKATEPGLQTRLAGLYVSRHQWLKPLQYLLIILFALWFLYYLMYTLPEQRQRDALPEQARQQITQIIKIAKDNTAIDRAQQYKQSIEFYLQQDELDKAQSAYRELQSLTNTLHQNYELRVVARPGQASGVWRVPDVNTNNRNYYLIVEAIDENGKRLTVPVISEETNQQKLVDSWGLRVDKQTFNRVANDKRDDGIIQKNIVGEKTIGFSEPSYFINTTGGTITEW